MKEETQIRKAKINDKKIIYNLIRRSMPEDKEFAKRYLELYFNNDTLTKKDLLFVSETNNLISGVIGFCQDY